MIPCGQVIDQRFEVLAPLGQGGMGAVYRVRHVHLNQELALKTSLSHNTQAEALFLQEARILASLQHPALPRVLDFFTTRGEAYLVMDYVPGDDLQTRLDQQGPISEIEARTWLRQLLEALAYIHAHGVVHRDIKPANLKLTPAGKLMLVDFGIAKGGSAAPAHTAYHARQAYTPYLAPPEQIAGQGTGPRSDLFMAASSFTYLLTGTLPPMPGAVPGPLGPVLAKAMAPDPAGRYPDALAMRQAIAGAASPGLPGARRDIRR